MKAIYYPDIFEEEGLKNEDFRSMIGLPDLSG